MEDAPKVIDTHAHLEEFADPDEVVREAQAAGVLAIVAVGQDIPSNRITMEAASRHVGVVFPAIGYHPWRLSSDAHKQTLDFIDGHLGGCVALGEVGLDYKAKTKKKIQKGLFQDLLSIAKRHNKPVLLHCRYSHERAYEMVKEAGIEKAVFHWYSGPLELIPRIAGDGYYMSASPALIYNPYHEKAIYAVPLPSLLLETDAPVQYRELSARPVHAAEVTLREVARVKGLPATEIAAQTTRNAIACFGLRDLVGA